MVYVSWHRHRLTRRSRLVQTENQLTERREKTHMKTTDRILHVTDIQPTWTITTFGHRQTRHTIHIQHQSTWNENSFNLGWKENWLGSALLFPTKRFWTSTLFARRAVFVQFILSLPTTRRLPPTTLVVRSLRPRHRPRPSRLVKSRSYRHSGRHAGDTTAHAFSLHRHFIKSYTPAPNSILCDLITVDVFNL